MCRLRAAQRWKHIIPLSPPDLLAPPSPGIIFFFNTLHKAIGSEGVTLGPWRVLASDASLVVTNSLRRTTATNPAMHDPSHKKLDV